MEYPSDFPFSDRPNLSPPDLVDYSHLHPTTLPDVRYEVTKTFEELLERSEKEVKVGQPLPLPFRPTDIAPSPRPRGLPVPGLQRGWDPKFINEVKGCTTLEQLRRVVIKYLSGPTLVWDSKAFKSGYTEKSFSNGEGSVFRALCAIYTAGIYSKPSWAGYNLPWNQGAYQPPHTTLDNHCYNGFMLELPLPRCTSQVYSFVKCSAHSSARTRITISSLDYFGTLKWIKHYDENEKYDFTFRGKKIAVLNPSNDKHIGGKWEAGDVGIESDMFLRTNMCTTLTSLCQQAKPYESVYTKGVTLIRAGCDEGFRFLTKEERMEFDVVSIFSYKYNSKTLSDKELEDLTYKRVVNALTACAHNNAKVVLLCPVGCGYLNNPPEIIARAFGDAVKLYCGYFDDIIISTIAESTEKAFTVTFKEKGLEPCELKYMKIKQSNSESVTGGKVSTVWLSKEDQSESN